MPAAIANLIHETSVSTGTGNLTTAAVSGKQTFNTAFGNGATTNVFFYFISNRAAAEYEWGEGHMSAASTLVRDTVRGGSNGLSAVNFSAGTKDVMCDLPADLQGSDDGFIFGLILSNNVTDITNDIDVAVGVAIDSTNIHRMRLAAAITKRLDAAWAVGTGNGGRMSAAAIANTTYHIFLIKRIDTGVVDVGFDVSATAPTMPANYTLFRRIGSITRVGGVIKPFKQYADGVFKWVTQVSEASVSADTTYALRALAVPLGIVVRPILRGYLMATSGDNRLVISDAADTGQINFQNMFCSQANTDYEGDFAPITYTNTSGQIHFSFEEGTTGIGSLTCLGYIDDLGRTI